MDSLFSGDDVFADVFEVDDNMVGPALYQTQQIGEKLARQSDRQVPAANPLDLVLSEHWAASGEGAAPDGAADTVCAALIEKDARVSPTMFRLG